VTYSFSLFEGIWRSFISHLWAISGPPTKGIERQRGALPAHAVNELVDFELHRDWALEKFGDKSGDWRALATRQGDVRKERMALQGFNDSDYAIVASNPKVVTLGNIVGHDHARALSDARENCQKHASFQRLRFINDHIGIV
jgi:hypothetical protein